MSTPEHADFNTDGHMHDCLFDVHDEKSECTKDCAAWLYALWTRSIESSQAQVNEAVRKARLDELELGAKRFYEADRDELPIERLYAQHLDRVNELQQLTNQPNPKEQ